MMDFLLVSIELIQKIGLPDYAQTLRFEDQAEELDDQIDMVRSEKSDGRRRSDLLAKNMRGDLRRYLGFRHTNIIANKCFETSGASKKI